MPSALSRFASSSIVLVGLAAPGVAFAHDPVVAVDPTEEDDEGYEDDDCDCGPPEAAPAAVTPPSMPGDGGPNVSTGSNGKTPQQEFDDAYKVPDPQIAFGLSVSLGVDALTNRGEWNAELARVGRPDLIDVGGELGARMSIFLEGFELALDVGLVFDARDHSAPPATSLLGGTAMAELSYDFLRSSLFTLGPSLGTGVFHSQICVGGAGASPAPEGAPPFQRVLADAGEEACLGSDALLIRPGLVFGIMAIDPGEGDRPGVFMNLRPTYSFLAKGSQVSLDGSSMPEFDGPSPVHPGFALDLEIGFLFGVGARKSGL